MIKPNDLSKITFFPERDLPKPEILNPSTAPSDFQIILQNAKEENPLENRQSQIESISKDDSKDADTSKIGKNQEIPPENSKNEKIDIEKEIESTAVTANLDPISTESEIENSEIELDSVNHSKNSKSNFTEQNTLSSDSFNNEKNNKGLSIASILLPVFQKEGVNELFQEKLNSKEREKSISSKEIFPQKSQRESGDLLKSAFLNNNLEKSSTKNKTDKESKNSSGNEKIKSNLKITDLKHSIDELKSNQVSKIDDKSLEMIKNSLLSGNVAQGEASLLNSKDDKKTKTISGLKTNSENSKKDLPTEEITNKLFNKENSTIQKVSKDEVTSITDKLRKIDNNTKKEKDNLTHVDLFKDNFIDKKTEEKSSQTSSNTIEQKSRQLESKSEVKSAQKPETVARNFAEIVKAARIQIVENGKNSAEISLQPKDLGKITLFVSEENNRLEGKILVENEATKQMILGDMAGLKAELKASGLDLFEIQVDINYDSQFKFTSSEKDREKNENTNEYSNNNKEFADETENEILSSETNLRLLDLKV
jgi:hypothetical protein